jgi:hypothetical protein
MFVPVLVCADVSRCRDVAVHEHPRRATTVVAAHGSEPATLSPLSSAAPAASLPWAPPLLLPINPSRAAAPPTACTGELEVEVGRRVIRLGMGPCSACPPHPSWAATASWGCMPHIAAPLLEQHRPPPWLDQQWEIEERETGPWQTAFDKKFGSVRGRRR